MDPNFSGGYNGLASAQVQTASGFQIIHPTEAQNLAEAMARRAVALDPADAEAHSSLALTLWYRGDYEGALAEAELALQMSPNLAFAHAMRGAALIFSGHPQDGLMATEISIRLDPNDPMLASRLNQMSYGLYFSGEYEAAVEAARRAVRSNPDLPQTYRWLAAALGQLGQIEQAREALEKAIAVAPASFDMFVRNRVPWMRPEDHAHMLDGLRKAGWEG